MSWIAWEPVDARTGVDEAALTTERPEPSKTSMFPAWLVNVGDKVDKVEGWAGREA